MKNSNHPEKIFVRTFGGLTVYRHHSPVVVSWESQKARMLFCYLLVTSDQWVHRDQLIELLWPSWQPYAEEYGVTSSRFKTGMTDCSLCGLCLRYCSEVKKANRIYFKGRGIDRHPELVEGSELSCRACGECFSLCGSGWIASRC